MKISKLTFFKGTVLNFSNFAKFRSVSVRSVSRNFGQFRKVSFREISVNFSQGEIRIFCHFRVLNSLSYFKSIINQNQQNYTSLKGLFAKCSKLQPNVEKRLTKTDRNVSWYFSNFQWFRNFGANPSYAKICTAG